MIVSFCSEQVIFSFTEITIETQSGVRTRIGLAG
jgi:hypothetical protein